jgi:hypothetical protein
MNDLISRVKVTVSFHIDLNAISGEAVSLFDIVVEADHILCAISTSLALILLIIADIKILLGLWSLLVFAVITGRPRLVLHVKRVGTYAWIAESLVKAVVEANLPIFTCVIRLARVSLGQAFLIEFHLHEVILFEVFFNFRLLCLRHKLCVHREAFGIIAVTLALVVF